MFGGCCEVNSPSLCIWVETKTKGPVDRQKQHAWGTGSNHCMITKKTGQQTKMQSISKQRYIFRDTSPLFEHWDALRPAEVKEQGDTSSKAPDQMLPSSLDRRRSKQ